MLDISLRSSPVRHLSVIVRGKGGGGESVGDAGKFGCLVAHPYCPLFAPYTDR